MNDCNLWLLNLIIELRSHQWKQRLYKHVYVIYHSVNMQEHHSMCTMVKFEVHVVMIVEACEKTLWWFCVIVVLGTGRPVLVPLHTGLAVTGASAQVSADSSVQATGFCSDWLSGFDSKQLCPKGAAGELEAVPELQINESLLSLMWLQTIGRTCLGLFPMYTPRQKLKCPSACYQPRTCHRVTVAGALSLLRYQLLSGR